MNTSEVNKLEDYLQDKFDSDDLKVKHRRNQSDSVEVFVAGEFMGVIYRDEDEGEVSYQFHMTILEEDLA